VPAVGAESPTDGNIMLSFFARMWYVRQMARQGEIKPSESCPPRTAASQKARDQVASTRQPPKASPRPEARNHTTRRVQKRHICLAA